MSENKDDNKPFEPDQFGRRLDFLWTFVVDHPRMIIIAIALLTVISGFFLTRLKVDPSLETLIVEDHPSRIAYRDFLDQFGTDEFLIIVAGPNSGNLFTPEHLGAIKKVSEDLAALPQVMEVQSLFATAIVRANDQGVDIRPLFDDIPQDPKDLEALRALAVSNPLLSGTIVSEKGDACLWLAFPERTKEDSTEDRIALYQAARETARKWLGDFEVHIEGVPAVKAVMVEYIVRGMIIFGTASAFFLCLVLYLTFGSWRGVTLPMTVVVLALFWTLGTMGATGGVLDTISSLIFALVLVVGVGDTIHILIQYFEDFYEVGKRRQALILTMRKMFTPCLLTSLTTAVGFLSLTTIKIPPIQRFGIYAGVGVFSAFVISILLVPAVLRLLPAPTSSYQVRFSRGFLHRRLVTLAQFNLRHKGGILIASTLILVVSIVGIMNLRVETRVREFFHPWSDIVKGVEFLEKHFDARIPMEIVLKGKADDFLKPENWKWVDALSKDLVRVPHINRADSYLDVLKELQWAFTGGGDRNDDTWKIPATRQAVAQYSLLFQMDDPETTGRLINTDFSKAHISLSMDDITSKKILVTIAQVEDTIRRHVPADIQWELAGGTVMFVHLTEILVNGQVRSLAMALFIITLMTALIFRSAKIGLLSMIPNVLPILAMLGIMGLLGFPLDTNTVMIGPITIGIAVDDTIHYITRYRRERCMGMPSAEAMSHTLITTGRALVSTSVILAIGFSITLLSSFRPQSILGGLGALTILLALAADLVLLPAVMLLFFKEKKDGQNARLC